MTGSNRASTAPAEWILVGLVTFLSAGVLTSSSCLVDCEDDDDDDGDDDDCCYGTTDDDDDGIFDDDDDGDDDDDCDDDDDDNNPSPETDGTGEGDYRLTEYELVRSHGAFVHPVAGIVRIVGPAVPAGGLESPSAAVELTRQVLHANPDLLGLPPASGELQPLTVEPTDHGFDVVWLQAFRTAGGGFLPVPNTRVVFRFDAFGRLFAIENRTRMFAVPFAQLMSG